jgi:hypothetical protein
MQPPRGKVPVATGLSTTLARVVVLATLAAVPIRASSAEPVPGYDYRRPRSQAELRYWLENMVWYHRFTGQEIEAATGLPEAEIEQALSRFDIRPQTRPAPAADAPLLMLPWPGGRAVSNWGGEVERTRQRETKVTVFAPWDQTSYVVLDVPEAIWSNLGLLYLAHVDVPTIWTKQGIELAKLEWNRRPDGGLEITRKLPNGVGCSAKILPFRRAIRMKLTLTNGTRSVLTGLRVQNCVFLKGLKGFENEAKPRAVSSPSYNARGTAEATRWVITGWVPGGRAWGNERNPCFHCDPTFEDCLPGSVRAVYGWLSFYEGDDIKGEFERIDRTGWRSEHWEDTPHWAADPEGRQETFGSERPVTTDH